MEVDERGHQRFGVGEETGDFVADRRGVRSVHRDVFFSVQTEAQRLFVIDIHVAVEVFQHALFPIELVIVFGATGILLLVEYIAVFVESLDGVVVQKSAVHKDMVLPIVIPFCTCHRGEEHWDGLKYPFECAVCGAGGDLIRGEDGQVRFVLAENGLIRDRNVNESRALHLKEIVETRIDFLKRQDEIGDLKKHYEEVSFPAI